MKGMNFLRCLVPCFFVKEFQTGFSRPYSPVKNEKIIDQGRVERDFYSGNPAVKSLNREIGKTRKVAVRSASTVVVAGAVGAGVGCGLSFGGVIAVSATIGAFTFPVAPFVGAAVGLGVGLAIVGTVLAVRKIKQICDDAGGFQNTAVGRFSDKIVEWFKTTPGKIAAVFASAMAGGAIGFGISQGLVFLGVIAASAAIGQVAVPVPVIGAVIGASAAAIGIGAIFIYQKVHARHENSELTCFDKK